MLSQKDEDRRRYILADNLNNKLTNYKIGYLLKLMKDEGWTQRSFNDDYVWSNTRATYYLESIFLKYELQPIVIYENNSRTVVCDGYNRLLTLERFFRDELELTQSGLPVLKFLDGKKFSDLDEDYQKYLLQEFSISVRKFTIKRPELNLSLEDDEEIEKQLYIRYNSGTELQPYQMHKALYHSEPFTNLMTSKLEENKLLFQKLVDIKILDPRKKKNTIDEGMVRIREMIGSIYCPLGNFLHFKKKDDKVQNGYLPYIKDKNPEEVFELFTEIIDILYQIKMSPSFKKYEILDSYRFFSLTFWLLATLKKDNLFTLEKVDLKAYIEYCGRNDTAPSYFKSTKELQIRSVYDGYQFIIEGARKLFSLDLSTYLEVKEVRKPTIDEINEMPSFKELENIQYIIRDADDNENIDVGQLIDLIQKKVYIVHGPYQRNEVINLKQASRMLESIFMDIPYPSIIVYKYMKNGKEINEILDGQQRILSILAFLKKEYVNEKGELTKTDKHNFTLQKLKVFTECNGKKYDGKNGISEYLQEKITDYSITMRVIDSKLNPQYSPEQNFKRLNESINNLKEDTYRMWNVDCDKFVMRKINEVTAKYIGNIFPTVHDCKKRFESIVTLCIYHEFQNYKQNYKERNWRKVSKKDITIWLNAISDKNRSDYFDSISRADKILSNIEEWLTFIDVPLYEIIKTGKYQITEKKVSLLYYFLSNTKLVDLKRHSNEILLLLKEFYIKYTSQQKNKDFDMKTLIKETRAKLKMIC